MGRSVHILLAVFLSSSASVVLAQSEKTRISGMVIGCYYANEFDELFKLDPLFTGAVYPLPPWLTEDEKSRLHRIYYPRTRQSLIESYDVLVFDGALITHFTPGQFQDLDYAFREGGMTAIIAPVVMFSDVIQPTILSEVVPVSDAGAVIFKPYSVKFREQRDPVFLPFVELGIENVAGSQTAEIVVKQGATIWADERPQDRPWLVSWRPGGGDSGMQWVVAHRFDDWWREQFNPYLMDVETNMILYSLDRPLIDDIQARREARRLFVNFQTQKSLMLSMIEWVDSFGANTHALTDRLVGLQAGLEDAVKGYLDQDYVSAISFLQSVSDTIVDISEDVVRLKNQVLFWVYLIEWLAVSGTSMTCAFILWSLMIRKQLYRQVSTTRFEA